jgi:pantetheine-phosphate adenylyltransferase
MKKCVFAGTFDPPTLGHADTVRQAAKIFDEVTVAILINPQKEPVFTLEERKEMLKLLCKDIPNTKIISWQGCAVDLLKAENTPFYVRGVRNTVDLEYENAAYYASRKLDESMVTIYLPAKQEHLHISSTLVKNSIRFQKPIEECVGKEVAEYIYKILRQRGNGNV